MKRLAIRFLLLFFFIGTAAITLSAQLRTLPESYVILARSSLMSQAGWKSVVDTLLSAHPQAHLLYFKSHPDNCKDTLQLLRPRYLAVVEDPRNLDKHYTVQLNTLCRNLDADPYKDCIWGVITGYSPRDAIRMVRDARTPFQIHTAVSTISELKSGIWFSRMVCVEDQNRPFAVDKTPDSLRTYKIPDAIMPRQLKPYPNLLGSFHQAMRTVQPDLVVTASHATEENLEMPGSLGNIRAIRGMLYTEFPTGALPLLPSEESSHRRVYLPIGNCLIANANKDLNSMAVAWLSSGKASCLIGYVVETWYGRAGWGGLKYFLHNAGRLNCQQAFFLNDLELIRYNQELLPQALNKPYDPSLTLDQLQHQLAQGQPLTKDALGMYYDRDVLMYYGDPAWQVELPTPKETPADYTVTYNYTPEALEIILRTHENFNPCNYKGNGWKSEHVADLPLAFYFPQRIDAPLLQQKAKHKGNYILTEEALLIYNPTLQPNRTYRWYIHSVRK